jgi:Zn-dependent peptidase ImmA (M78 family)
MAHPRNEAFVKHELLAWAREDAGVTLEDAARRIGVKPERLENCEQGRRRLTVNQLRALSNVYKRPLAFFYLPQPPPRTVTLRDFRRLPDEGVESESPKLRHEIRRAKYRRQVALNLYAELGEQPTAFTATTTLQAKPDDVAREIRELLKVTTEEQYQFASEYEALNRWRGAIEDPGVMVFQASGIKRKEMRGLSITEYPLPVIVINNKDIPQGRIFTMLHELTHIMLRMGGRCNLEEKQQIEVFCNMVAGAVLVPEDCLLNERIVKESGPRDEWSDLVIKSLARRYVVSREVILRRLLIAGYTTQEFYRRKREQYRKEWSEREAKNKSEGGSGGPPPDVMAVSYAGRAFVQLVLDSFYQRRITASDVSDYLEISTKYVKSVERLVQNPTLELGAA